MKSRAKLDQIEEIVEKDLSNGKHLQKKVVKKLKDAGVCPEEIVERIRKQKEKRTLLKGE